MLGLSDKHMMAGMQGDISKNKFGPHKIAELMGFEDNTDQLLAEVCKMSGMCETTGENHMCEVYRKMAGKKVRSIISKASSHYGDLTGTHTQHRATVAETDQASSSHASNREIGEPQTGRRAGGDRLQRRGLSGELPLGKIFETWKTKKQKKSQKKKKQGNRKRVQPEEEEEEEGGLRRNPEGAQVPGKFRRVAMRATRLPPPLQHL